MLMLELLIQDVYIITHTHTFTKTHCKHVLQFMCVNFAIGSSETFKHWPHFIKNSSICCCYSIITVSSSGSGEREGGGGISSSGSGEREGGRGLVAVVVERERGGLVAVVVERERGGED